MTPRALSVLFLLCQAIGCLGALRARLGPIQGRDA